MRWLARNRSAGSCMRASPPAGARRLRVEGPARVELLLGEVEERAAAVPRVEGVAQPAELRADRVQGAGPIGTPTANSANSPSSAASAPAGRPGRGQLAAEVAQLDGDEGEPEPGPGALEQGVDGLAGERVHEEAVADRPDRARRDPCAAPAVPAPATVARVSSAGPSARRPARERGGLGRVAEGRPRRRRTARRAGTRGSLAAAAPAAGGPRSSARPARPGVSSCQAPSTSRARSHGYSSMPGVDLGDRVEANSSAVTAAKLPPPPRRAQNSSGSSRVDAQQPAVGGTTSAADDAVGGQAVAAGEPADAAAERVADDADVGRRPGQRREPELGGGRRDLIHSAPASTRARRAPGSMRTPRMRSVLTRIAPSRQSGAAAWPVPCIATRRPVLVGVRARAAATSSARSGYATSSGLLVDRRVPGAARACPSPPRRAGRWCRRGAARAGARHEVGGRHQGSDAVEVGGRRPWGAAATPSSPRCARRASGSSPGAGPP